MSARERLRIMIRPTRGSMTVWSQPEIDDAFAAYDAEHRADVLAEAAALADPAKPEVSFFGDYGPQVAWWLRMLIGRWEKATPAGATVTPFFEPSRTYLRFVGDRELYFRVSFISPDNPNSPDSTAGNGPVAFGWVRTDRSATVWEPSGKTSFVGWTDVTDEVAS